MAYGNAPRLYRISGPSRTREDQTVFGCWHLCAIWPSKQPRSSFTISSRQSESVLLVGRAMICSIPHPSCSDPRALMTVQSFRPMTVPFSIGALARSTCVLWGPSRQAGPKGWLFSVRSAAVPSAIRALSARVSLLPRTRLLHLDNGSNLGQSSVLK